MGVSHVGIGKAVLKFQDYNLTGHSRDLRQFAVAARSALQACDKAHRPLSFLEGYPGALWASGLLDPKLTKLQTERAKAKRRLLNLSRRIQNEQLEFEFVDGWVGVGWYWLSEDGPLARKELEHIIERIRCAKKPTAIGDFWVSHRKEGAAIDLGLPHGVIGVLLFLSACFQKGIRKSTCRQEATSIINFLMQVVEECPSRPFPSLLPERLRPLNRKVAWCYGELVLAYSLVVVGLRFERKDWTDTGRRLFQTRALPYLSKTRPYTPFLCHGSAGIAQILLRLFIETNDMSFYRLWSNWNKRTISGLKSWRTKRPQFRPTSLFYNAWGVKLATRSSPSSGNSWDAIMMLSVPARGRA